MKDDATLLHGYARNHSESDFAELVQRYVDLVYPKFRRREVTEGSEVAGIWRHGRKRGGGGRSPGG
jgi:hypothetical protein